MRTKKSCRSRSALRQVGLGVPFVLAVGVAGAADCVNGINASGSCTLPANVTGFSIEAIGGGGGGGSACDWGAGAGGGGGYCKGNFTATSGSTLAVTVGAFGAKAVTTDFAAGSAGGTSSVLLGVSTLVAATGGGGGADGNTGCPPGPGSPVASAGGTGGTCTTNGGTSPISSLGGAGGSITTTLYSYGGAGGGGAGGAAGNGANGTGNNGGGISAGVGGAGTAPGGAGGTGGTPGCSNPATSSVAAQNGTAPGGGGGASGDGSNGTLSCTGSWGSSAVGDGAAGQVSITWVGPFSTTTTITSDLPDPSVVGQSVPVVCAVTPSGGGPAAGTVIISASTGESCGPTALAAGTGSCNLTFNIAGPRNLTCAYTPSLGNNFVPSQSASVPHDVANPIPVLQSWALGLLGLLLTGLAGWRHSRRAQA